MVGRGGIYGDYYGDGRELEPTPGEERAKAGPKPYCVTCNGIGWVDGKDYDDGSSSSARPCPKCSNIIVSD